jgi:hypothetical protein
LGVDGSVQKQGQREKEGVDFFHKICL